MDLRSSNTRRQMDRLASLARGLLSSMFDEASGLFAHKALKTSNGTHSVGTNPLYSAMSVIGIEKDGRQTASRTIRVEATLDSLYTLASRRSCSTGLLAASLWALSAAGDERATSLLQPLERRFKASRGSSMELGLVVSGLAATIGAFPGLDAARQVAGVASRELLDRFSDSAQLFRGVSWAPLPKRSLQWNMTSFASQIYPIHGLAELARVGETAPPTQVLRAADRLVELQGPLGQWWWIYSPRTGVRLEGYPVYTVHQHAMAFMALAPLENLGLRIYRGALERSLRWIFGENELGASLVDLDGLFISRCIQRRGADADGLLGMSSSQWWKVVLSSWGLRPSADPEPKPNDLEILQECRPYELGWLLYARWLIADW